MTASVKTPIKPTVNKQPAQPTIKTPIAKSKLSREKERGGLWVRVPQNGGDEYMTGEFLYNGEKIPIIVFRNAFREHDRMPDWRIYERDQLGTQRVTNQNTDTIEQNPALLS